MIDSVFRTGKNYLFLEERKYVIKRKICYIIDDIEVSSDSDLILLKLCRRNSDEKTNTEKNSDEENSSEKKIFFQHI